MSPDDNHTTPNARGEGQAPPPPQARRWLESGEEQWAETPAPADDDEIVIGEDPADPDPEAPLSRSFLSGRRKGAPRRGLSLKKPADAHPTPLTPEQRLLILDSWQRSGLPAGDFAPLVGVSKHTLYSWKNKFEAEGPAGLMDRPKGGPKGSRASELTKRAIIMMKETNPDWGVQKISDMLLRGPAQGYRLRNNIGQGYQQYAELHLEVRSIGVYDSPTVCRFQWQAGMLNERPASEGFTEWYAGRMHVETDIYDMLATLRGAERVARLLAEVDYRRSPLATVRALEAAGIIRLEYDNVVSQFVSVQNLSMAPMASWRDDYARTGERNCQHHVLAETSEEAQRLMLKAFGTNVSRDDGAAMRRWIDSGKPVVRMYSGATSVASIFDVIGATAEVAKAQTAKPQEQPA